jgi:hypothetical protein
MAGRRRLVATHVAAIDAASGEIHFSLAIRQAFNLAFCDSARVETGGV